MKTRNKTGLMGAGLLSAIAASLCCITPILAMITGASGIASTFSWMEPFRPVLIGITLAALSFAWYQKVKPVAANEIDCACETEEKPSFLQSKKFLGIVTVFAIVMLAFPYYGEIFYPSTKENGSTVITPNANNFQQISFKVRGMTCESCQSHIEHNVNKLPGIKKVQADFRKGTATIKFDPSKTSKAQLVMAIDETGYKVQGETKQ